MILEQTLQQSLAVFNISSCIQREAKPSLNEERYVVLRLSKSWENWVSLFLTSFGIQVDTCCSGKVLSGSHCCEHAAPECDVFSAETGCWDVQNAGRDHLKAKALFLFFFYLWRFCCLNVLFKPNTTNNHYHKIVLTCETPIMTLSNARGHPVIE